MFEWTIRKLRSDWEGYILGNSVDGHGLIQGS